MINLTGILAGLKWRNVVRETKDVGDYCKRPDEIPCEPELRKVTHSSWAIQKLKSVGLGGWLHVEDEGEGRVTNQPKEGNQEEEHILGNTQWFQLGTLRSFARATITRYHTLRGLNNRIFTPLTILEARSWRSRCWQVWFLLSPPSLAGGWLPSNYIYPRMVFSLYMHPWYLSVGPNFLTF